MPVEVTIDDDKQLIIQTVIGKTSHEELRTAIKQLSVNNNYKNILWDFRKGTLAGVSSEELDSLTDYIKNIARNVEPGGKVALVSAEGIDFGLSRMMENHSQIKRIPYEVMVFISFKEAIKWIESE